MWKITYQLVQRLIFIYLNVFLNLNKNIDAKQCTHDHRMITLIWIIHFFSFKFVLCKLYLYKLVVKSRRIFILENGTPILNKCMLKQRK